jgi:mannose-6-phosphate isomerase
LSPEPQTLAQNSAAIIFCIEGQTVLEKGEETLVLKPGESGYLSASESPVEVSGNGRIARVFNKL